AVVLGEQPAVVIEAEQTGEAAEPVEYTRGVCTLQQRRHASQALLVEIEVEPGIAIGNTGCLLVIHECFLPSTPMIENKQVVGKWCAGSQQVADCDCNTSRR